MHYPEATFMGFAFGVTECGPMSSLDVRRRNIVLGARSFTVNFTRRDEIGYELSNHPAERRVYVDFSDDNPTTSLTIKAFAPRTNNRFHVVNYGHGSGKKRERFTAAVANNESHFLGPYRPQNKQEMRLGVMSRSKITGFGTGTIDEITPYSNINSTFI